MLGGNSFGQHYENLFPAKREWLVFFAILVCYKFWDTKFQKYILIYMRLLYGKIKQTFLSDIIPEYKYSTG